MLFNWKRLDVYSLSIKNDTVLCNVILGLVSADSPTTTIQLMKARMKDYDKNIFPRCDNNDTSPVEVSLDMAMRQILDLVGTRFISLSVHVALNGNVSVSCVFGIIGFSLPKFYL